jgi:predicted metal-dependent enzyme (double-stranded beta helix superfamily)
MYFSRQSSPMTTMTHTRPGLDALVGRIRDHVDWTGAPSAAAWAVADILRADLPPLDMLTAEERTGDSDGYTRHLLHAESRFSIVAIVWQPGQLTDIHDHIAWCTFAVLQGVEYETLYRDEGDHLVEIGSAANHVGDVSGFAPPGDIHRVHNVGDTTAISLHVYGADMADSPSSVRRVYDLPVI